MKRMQKGNAGAEVDDSADELEIDYSESDKASA